MQEVIVNVFAGIGIVAIIMLIMFIVIQTIEFIEDTKNEKHRTKIGIKIIEDELKAIRKVLMGYVSESHFEEKIDILTKCNNQNRDSQKNFEERFERIYQRKSDQWEAVKKLSENIGKCKIDIESLTDYSIKADKKIAELETKIDNFLSVPDMDKKEKQ
jgi:biopolymer transport protein ExbB/TolQ